MKCKKMHLFCPFPVKYGITLNWQSVYLKQTEEHGQIHRDMYQQTISSLLLLLSTLNIKCTEIAIFLSFSYASFLGTERKRESFWSNVQGTGEIKFNLWWYHCFFSPDYGRFSTTCFGRFAKIKKNRKSVKMWETPRLSLQPWLFLVPAILSNFQGGEDLGHTETPVDGD